MKLKDWVKKEGRTLRWVADNAGVGARHFYQYVEGLRPLKDEFIDKIMTLTNGECTYEDLKRYTPTTSSKKEAPKNFNGPRKAR
jgi:hypothetical protein